MEKIAKVIAKVLDTQIKTTPQINPEDLRDDDLMGFGSGMCAAEHHHALLELAD
ncbi:MAG: hypothetical protein QHG99_06850 [Methanomicrobiales archaeon]|nr:hypothetical protein [Methanomicrobiales archaeon]